MWYVYYLYSQEKNIYYIGKTCDIKRRLTEHNNHEEKFTKRTKNWNLVGLIECETSIIATRIERKLKKAKNKKYVQWYFQKNGIKV
ncbi:MAG: hypothetical protein A3J66_01210 [Candidatus Magasanikbacteria bacterium RIFCSPHIGHO2_02_FULL_47_14]|uniref:GIY-YIG domain-containing protein n=1 Tax=Candidatus Magasanikbacteria bacterium RIFCSPHIGHO2_02_FULL_47_14 TaxID=1798680 RepID=A0A1F6M7D4_9BACT|nr:MAG: hypothetical protein A3J66_01210 [Candidatus Magasanikbacteria bacterium RIFCSPHIGHO2_02_FULL_47_14]